MIEHAEHPMARVVVTRALVGICFMQVCAIADATDEEILAVCNQDNPSGTTNGWTRVIREGAAAAHGEPESLITKNKEPVPCGAHPGRWHFLAVC